MLPISPRRRLLCQCNVPRLVASVDEFSEVEDYPEDDPWYPTVSAENSMKPHYFEETEKIKVKSRAVEFGWCENRKMIGFCLVESEHVYNDLSEFMPSP